MVELKQLDLGSPKRNTKFDAVAIMSSHKARFYEVTPRGVLKLEDTLHHIRSGR